MSTLKIIASRPPPAWTEPWEGSSLPLASDVATRRVYMVAQPVATQQRPRGAWRLWAGPVFLALVLAIAVGVC